MDKVAERIVERELSGNGSAPAQEEVFPHVMVTLTNKDGTQEVVPWELAMVRFQSETLKEVKQTREALEAIAEAAKAFKMPFGFGKKGAPGAD
jgi:hypothetical protein